MPDEIEPFDTDHWLYVAYDDLAEKLRHLSSLLGERGLRFPSSGRFAQYQRAFMAAKKVAEGSQTPKDFHARLFHQASFETDQLCIIVKQLSDSPEVSGWQRAVQKILSGRSIPDAKEGSTSSRDHQFELFLAALSKSAGYHIRLEEPDVVIQHSHLEFGIAAKRPKSLNRLTKTVKKAVQQITDSRRQGLIAIDISLLQNPESAFMIVELPEQATAAVRHFADHFWNANATRIRSLVDLRNTFGAVIFMSCLFYVRGAHLGSTFLWVAGNLGKTTDHRFSVLRDFVEKVAESTVGDAVSSDELALPNNGIQPTR